MGGSSLCDFNFGGCGCVCGDGGGGGMREAEISLRTTTVIDQMISNALDGNWNYRMLLSTFKTRNKPNYGPVYLFLL